MDATKIYTEALLAAREAAQTENAKLGDEQKRGLDCGFAWVQIVPARGEFVNYCKANKIGDKHWDKGWYLWGSRLHNVATQSISVHYQAAQAFAKVLQGYGILASADSRYD